MRLRTIARGTRRGAALVGLGLVGGAALVTARHALMTPQPLRSGLPGEGRLDRKHGGDVYYSVAGPQDAHPLVLLHDFYPGASNYEFRAVYSRLAEMYRVYAPDWLGFGMSERPPLILTGEFYATMLVGFLRDVVGQPAVVVARGRAANIATRAAADAPEQFDRLALVGPDLEAGERLDPTAGQVIARLFQRLALGLTPYATLSMRPALRLAEGSRSAVGPAQVDDETVDHLYASAHQFGGQHGALALMTGELDLPIQHVFPTLEPPTLLVIGERDRKAPVARLERLVALNQRADLEVILSAGATVYQDQPKLFVGALNRWLSRQSARRIAQHVDTRTVAEIAPEAELAEERAPAVSSPPEPAITPGPEATPTDAAPELAPWETPTPEPPATDLELGSPDDPNDPNELAGADDPVATVSPVKIVPVLDAPDRQPEAPPMRTQTGPKRERKPAPHAAPKGEGQTSASASSSRRRRGNIRKTSSGRSVHRRRNG